jgi:hypothetical protein
MTKRIALLLGGTELLAAVAIGLTVRADPASAARPQNGANLYNFVDPADSANYHPTVTGVATRSFVPAAYFVPPVSRRMDFGSGVRAC